MCVGGGGDLSAQLQGGTGHLGGAQLHEGVPPLGVHGSRDHRVQTHHLQVTATFSRGKVNIR